MAGRAWGGWGKGRLPNGPVAAIGPVSADRQRNIGAVYDMCLFVLFALIAVGIDTGLGRCRQCYSLCPVQAVQIAWAYTDLLYVP